VNGSEIAWDLDRTSGPSTGDRNFYHTQLRAQFINDDANTYNFTPVTTGIFTNNATSSFDNGTHGTYNVAFPDVVTTTNGSSAAITYLAGVGGTAGVQYGGSGGGGKVVNWGFPFETITDPAVRDAYMSDVLRYFGAIPAPRLQPMAVTNNGSNVFLSWNSSSGLKYRVEFKSSLTNATWLPLGADITATNTMTSATDGNVPTTKQKYYRIFLVN